MRTHVQFRKAQKNLNISTGLVLTSKGKIKWLLHTRWRSLRRAGRSREQCTCQRAPRLSEAWRHNGKMKMSLDTIGNIIYSEQRFIIKIYLTEYQVTTKVQR